MMKTLLRYLERVVVREENGPLSWSIRLFLWPLSFLYQAGLAVYLFAYKSGLRKRYRLPVPVISVGNLTFGGTGKTPAVQFICRMLQSQGKQVAVLSRGHGGDAVVALVVSDGSRIECASTESGDEPLLLAKTLPGIPVVVGKDRRTSGELACGRFKPDVIVLDDGLQYWQLHRDLDIIVMRVEKPFGSGFVMPMGDLREPVRGLRRAGVILVNGIDGVEPTAFSSLNKRIREISPKSEVFGSRVAPVTLRRFGSGLETGPEWLRGKRIIAFCGIGKPDSFKKILESLGADVALFLDYPDHFVYTIGDLNYIQRQRAHFDAEAVVTTEKDLARLDGQVPIDNLYGLEIKLEIENIPAFQRIIFRAIDGANQTPPA